MKSLLWFSLLCFSLSVFGQEEKEGKRINIKNADKGIYQKYLGKNRLLGNVVFEHEGSLMYCDSAWFYSKENRLEAFQNVKINQGDTIFLWGDYLEYSGNTRQALVTGDTVKLQDKKMVLYTDRLDYNRKTNIAYYTTGGTILSDENILISRKGNYSTSTKLFNFKDSVVLTNPDYVIESDTLIYSSASRNAFFHGPTTITSDSSYIYCENGVYNTITDIARFERNARLYDDNKYLTGDSLYYEKATEFGEAFGNVFIHDTLEDYFITGGYGRYLGDSDSAFVTLEPVYSIVQSNDTLHIHGDTLFSTIATDSLGDFRQLKVFHRVRIFKTDIQGWCDSLSYSTRDSTFKMYYDPILWNDSTQITGDTIFMSINNDEMDSLKVFGNAFIISIVDSIKHDQIKGRKMFGKFYDNDLRRVYVDGNGQTLYYPKDDKGEFIGMNKSISSNIIVLLADNTVKKIKFLKKPEAKLHPIEKIVPGEDILEGFTPRFDIRPQCKQDIFK